MENFYKKTEQPIFTKLRGQVLPLAINFYTSINELVIQNINRIIKLHVNESNCQCLLVEDQVWYTICKDREDYLEYYKDEVVKYENLTGGTSLNMYYL